MCMAYLVLKVGWNWIRPQFTRKDCSNSWRAGKGLGNLSVVRDVLVIWTEGSHTNVPLTLNKTMRFLFYPLFLHCKQDFQLFLSGEGSLKPLLCNSASTNVIYALCEPSWTLYTWSFAKNLGGERKKVFMELSFSEIPKYNSYLRKLLYAYFKVSA